MKLTQKKYVIFADFKSFKIIFIDFLSHFLLIIFTIFLDHQNPGPDYQYYKYKKAQLMNVNMPMKYKTFKNLSPILHMVMDFRSYYNK